MEATVAAEATDIAAAKAADGGRQSRKSDICAWKKQTTTKVGLKTQTTPRSHSQIG